MRDDELLRSFLMFRDHGDPAALAAVFDALAGDLLRLALHWTRRTADAEDAVAETFLAAMTHATRFDVSRPLQPWLVGILAHQARRIRDASLRARTPLDRIEPEPSRGPVDDASNREWAALTHDAVLRMAPRDRLVLEPILFRGASIGDVARSLDAKAGTVRVRLHRGLDRLRRLLPSRTAAFAITPNLVHVRAIVLRKGIEHGVLSPTAAAAWDIGVGATGVAGGWFAVHGSKALLAVTVALVGLGVLRFLTIADPAPERGIGAERSSGPSAAIAVEAASAHPPTQPSREPIAEPAAQPSPVPAAAATYATVRVIDRETQAPIAGATVVVDDGASRERSITDGDGHCSFVRSDLAPTTILCVLADGFADEVRRVDDDGPTTIELTRARNVRGVVTRRDCAIEPFAHVELLTDSRHTCEPPRAEADARGAFTLDRVDPRLTPMARARSVDGTTTGFAIVDAQVLAGEPLTIVLDRGADVVVRIVEAERGTPIRAATVVCAVDELLFAAPPKDVPLDALPYGATRTTANDGIARFERVPLLGLHVVAAAEGYALASTFLVQRQPEGDVELELALEAEGAVAGTVVDADGVVVPAARVDVAWSPIDLRSTAVMPFLRGHAELPEILRFTTTADAQGRFRVGSLEAARTVRIAARDPNTGIEGHVDVPLAAAESRTDLVVRLARPATLTIRARDASGAPLRSARVGAQRADELGTIRVATIEGHRRGFVVEAPQHVRQRVARGVELRDGLTVDVTLESALTVRGRVVDDRGAAAPDVILDASWVDGTEPDAPAEFVQSATRRDGTFELDGLPARRIHVALRSPAHADLELDVDVVTATSSAVVWTMRKRGAAARPASIEGTIVDATTGALRTDAKAVLVRAGELPTLDRIGESFVAQAGRFAFRDVAAGTVRILAYADGAASTLSPPFTLAPGATIEGVVLALAPGTTWSGTLRDARAEPHAGGLLRATRIVDREDEPALVREVRSGKHGEVTFSHLVPGRYRVTLRQREPPVGSTWQLECASGASEGGMIELGPGSEAILVVAPP